MRVNEILKEKKLTKKAFADMLGTLPQNINSAMKNPTAATLEKWAEALGVPLWQLFASPEEVAKSAKPEAEGVRLVCPHCGKPLHIDLSKGAE